MRFPLMLCALAVTAGGCGSRPQGCEPQSCESRGLNCGEIDDGCGTQLDCGICPGGLTCGAQTHRCGTGGCVPETSVELCVRLGKNCDPLTATDNCGASRNVDCGFCGGLEACVANVCQGGGGGAGGGAGGGSGGAGGGVAGGGSAGGRGGSSGTAGGGGASGTAGGGGMTCVPESNTTFCNRMGKNCDNVTGTDNCNVVRTVSCGSCAPPQSCGGGGVGNVCGCTPACGSLCGGEANGCGGSCPSRNNGVECQAVSSCLHRVCSNGACVDQTINEGVGCSGGQQCCRPHCASGSCICGGGNVVGSGRCLSSQIACQTSTGNWNCKGDPSFGCTSMPACCPGNATCQ